MLVRRRVALVVVLVTAAALLAACSGGDDEPEATPPEPAPTTTAPVPGTLPPALDDAEEVAGEDLEALGELIAFVEEARQASFTQAPIVRLAEDGTYEEILGPLLGISLEDLIAQAAYLEALGLIPAGSAIDYAQQQQAAVLGSLGAYDDVTGLLLVRGDDIDDPATQAVVVHELVHALDDQRLELTRPAYDADRTSERGQTFPMLVEGDATRVEEAYVATLDPDAQDEVEEENGSAAGDLADLGSFADFGQLGPYVSGRVFVEHLAGLGGEALVDAVFLDPPETTEQVLHPAVFDRDEGRVRIPPPPADGHIIDQGVSGELFFLGLFTYASPALDPSLAEPAAAGWGGDWSVSWADQDTGETCTRTDVVGDTPADAAELLAALEAWVIDRPTASVEAIDGGARMEVCYRVPLLASGNPAR